MFLFLVLGFLGWVTAYGIEAPADKGLEYYTWRGLGWLIDSIDLIALRCM